MKLIVDNEIVRLLAANDPKILEHPLIVNRENEVLFRWPSLLEYLELGEVLTNLPPFVQGQPLFQATITTLYETEENEVLFYIYDTLFTQNLNQIMALPQINASYLVQKIQERRRCENRALSRTLAAHEAEFVQNASGTMHDLILYLAWDRMCVCMANLFNHQSADPTFLRNLDILKNCLIESYLHIAKQRKTSPSIYRMIEALFFYQMREENLPKHTDAEWTLLGKSFKTFKSQDELVDYFYIDHAVIAENELSLEKGSLEAVLTLDEPDMVRCRLTLAQYMIGKLKAQVSNWDFVLRPKEVIYLSL